MFVVVAQKRNEKWRLLLQSTHCIIHFPFHFKKEDYMMVDIASSFEENLAPDFSISR